MCLFAKKKFLRLVLVNCQNECMKPQLFIGKQPKRQRIAPIVNRNDFGIKPHGGLWTSTYDARYGSDWVQWCLGEEFRMPEDNRWKGYLLYPKSYARILEIDSYRDLERLMGEYEHSPYLQTLNPTGFRIPGILRGLNYERLSHRYDAIHLTRRGQMETHFSDDYSLYGWDCESTLWLRWCFSRVKYVGKAEWNEREWN